MLKSKMMPSFALTVLLIPMSTQAEIPNPYIVDGAVLGAMYATAGLLVLDTVLLPKGLLRIIPKQTIKKVAVGTIAAGTVAGAIAGYFRYKRLNQPSIQRGAVPSSPH